MAHITKDHCLGDRVLSAQPKSSSSFTRGVDAFDQTNLTPSQLIQRIIKSYLKPQWKLLLISILAMFFTAATTGALPFLMQQVTDEIFVDQKVAFLYSLPLMVMGVMILRAITQFITRITQAKISNELIGNIRKDMFKNMIHADLNYLESMHSGRFISMFSNDVGLINNAAAGTLIAVIKNGLTALFLLSAMFVMDWFLSLILLLGAPLALYIMAKQRVKIRQSTRGQLREIGGLSSFILQTIHNVRIIKAYNRENHEQVRFHHFIRRIIKLLMRRTRAQATMTPITEALTGVGFAAAIFYAGWQGINGSMSLGNFTGFMTAAMLAYQPLKALAALQGQFTQGTEAAGRVFALIDYQSATQEPNIPKTLHVNDGEIVFDAVRYQYGSNDTEQAAIQNLTLTIPAGKKVALVGPSGAGKTTLINLVMRFFDPTEGKVMIDGQDIKSCQLSSVRNACALLTQDPILFDDTVFNNIAYGAGNATENDIEKAAKAADAHEFIMRLPNGYNTHVGEAGTLLSGGQKQRITIARTLLKNAPILLLDEPTSALDSESEDRIQKALHALFQKRTVLMIAHRLSTIQNADLICVLDQGRLVETGDHESLLAKNGLYAKFCRLQFNHGPAPNH